MRNFKQGKSQKGVTLIELMIALALGLVVIAGVVSGMSALYGSNRTQINNNNLQETGNMALDYITFQLRSALASPCDRFSVTNKTGDLTLSVTLPSASDAKDTSVTKTEDLKEMIQHLGVRVLTTEVKVDGKKLKTDNVTFFGTDNRFFDINPDKAVIKDTDYYVATDCKKIDIVQGSAVESTGMDIIAPLMVSAISIHKNSDTGRNRNTLYVRNLFSSRADRLTDNVEAMRILFGFDRYTLDQFTGKYSMGQDGIVDGFKTAKEVEDDIKAKRDNYQIISAEIYVLVRADEPDYSSPSNYTVYLPRTDKGIDKINEDSQIAFTDNVPRKVFTRSVNFRNTAKTW